MMDHREVFPTPRNDDSLLFVGRHTNHADQRNSSSCETNATIEGATVAARMSYFFTTYSVRCSASCDRGCTVRKDANKTIVHDKLKLGLQHACK